ncbi:unnamed protein product, partial [Cyprideis torosa]
MSIGRFFKVPRHRQFDYKPRFYDPDKEELEARLRRAKPLDDSDPEAVKARISGSFRRGGIYGNDKYRSAASQQKKNEFLRIALAHPDVFFSLHNNGKEHLHLPIGNQRQRIVNALGNQYNARLVPVEEETDIIT